MDKVAAYLVDKNLISKELAPWLTYAVYRFLLSAASYTALFLLGWLCAGATAAFLFLLSFTVLRRYIGGYHAGSPVKCIIISCSVEAFVLLFLLPIFSNFPYIFAFVLSLAAAVSIFILAPLPPKNLHETESERQALKKFSRIFTVITLCVCLLFLLFKLPSMGLCISLGMFCAAFTLWIEKIKLKGA